MNAAFFRNLFLGVAVTGSSAAIAWTSMASLAACNNLDETSVLPSTDASDLDAGQPPDDNASSSSSSSGGSSDAAAPPASARVRLANLLQGPSAVDLCAKVDANGTTWTNGLITSNPSEPSKPEGLNVDQISQSIFLSSTGSSGTKYLFEAVAPGTDCNDFTQPVFAKFASTALKPGGGVTLVAVGNYEGGVDAGDSSPRGVILFDTIAPPSTASLFRVVHGVPDLGPFDVEINGTAVLTGIKFASAFPFPYSSTTGFANIAAGIPDDATMTLNSGTTTKSFTIPTRLRRGIATTILVGGTKDNLDVQECADRTPDDPSATTATCSKLAPQ